MTIAELRKLDENGLEYKICQVCGGKVNEYSRWSYTGNHPGKRLGVWAQCEDCRDITKAWSAECENR